MKTKNHKLQVRDYNGNHFSVLPTLFAAIHESHYHLCNNDESNNCFCTNKKKNLNVISPDVNKM